jgi:hypothetical protein
MLKALVAGSPTIAGKPMLSAIIDELDEVIRVRPLQPRRRCRLLQILHSTRALDSALAVFLDHHRCPSGTSLGRHLKNLTEHRSPTLPNRLSQQARHRYQNTIVKNRNRYMHESGQYPSNDAEITNLLSEMHDCLVTVLSL